ncbi:MAG: hypothetical protein ABSE77_11870 [Acidimicrobiales bacterium]
MKKRSRRWAKMNVSADGAGVASHAGCELLREPAAATGLVGAWDRALIGTYSGLPIHLPGQVLADLAVFIGGGATSISDMKTLRDQPRLFGGPRVLVRGRLARCHPWLRRGLQGQKGGLRCRFPGG